MRNLCEFLSFFYVIFHFRKLVRVVSLVDWFSSAVTIFNLVIS